jgi:hypothetical protein
MTRRRRVLAFVLVTTTAVASQAVAVDVTPYAWEFPVVSGVDRTDQLVVRLQEEVQRILDAGRLAPLRVYHGDIATVEEYWLYTEPGRIIATLAWAYPYLTAAQQAAVRAYVAAELDSPTHAPWAAAPLAFNAGARRELHPLERATYRPYDFGRSRPTVHTIYGVWLYAFRTGDWQTVQAKWSNIKAMYSSRSSQGDIYGTMSAHVAMARLAEKFGDAATRSVALTNLQAQLDAGVTFSTIEARVSSKYWPEMYDARRAQGVYQGWMFLNLSPEIARYLGDHVRAAALSRHASGKAAFPLWWLRQASYFSRWTGDESVGLPPEIIGMMFPVERWVVNASAATLRDYVRSAPLAVGDCYWLEALVQAIESTGSITWVDVRSAAPLPPTGVVVRP